MQPCCSVCATVSCIWAVLYSVRYFSALLFRFLESIRFPPNNTRFRWFQVSQAWLQNSSNSSLVNLSIKYSMSYIMSVQIKLLFYNFWQLLAHISCIAEHSQIAWIVVFDSLKHIGHLSSGITLLCTRLALVGKISV